jgi:DNA-binding LacI/PurR family transcriptional regulator
MTVGGAVVQLQVAVCPHTSATHGEALTQELLAQEQPPDAIAAMSDELALGALRAAQRAAIAVPDALSITGWDDSDAAASAELTTLGQSLRHQGIRCARLALGKATPATDDARADWQVIRRRSTRVTPGFGC